MLGVRNSMHYLYYTVLCISLRPFCIGFLMRHGCRFERYHTSTICRLNRFLFEPSEAVKEIDGPDSTIVVTLSRDDYRTVHAAKVLGLQNGDTIRAGQVSSDPASQLTTDKAVIEWLPEGKVKKAEPLKNGDPPGSLRIRLHELHPADISSPKPAVSLILALPRPLQLGRMLPMISQMGVEYLILTEARKVPKDYFGSHLFRKPDQLTELMVEGLCQAGDVRLPRVQVVRHLTNFLSTDLDLLFPKDLYARTIAHPQRKDQKPLKRLRQISFPNPSERHVVVAVGPEGGWEEPGELQLFQSHGFEQITMGPRTLRSDCAVVSLLGLAHDACEPYADS